MPREGVENRIVRRGFTLVELMTVVVIIGVLGLLAVVAFRRYISSSRMAEATHMLEAIRQAEESYKAETSYYLDVSNDSTVSSGYPAYSETTNPGPPGKRKTAWGGPCLTCKSDWSNLNVRPDSPVQFAYTVVAGTAKDSPAARSVPTVFDGTTVSWTNITGPNSSNPWFIAAAYGDTDGNGKYCTVAANSSGPDLMIDQEGE